jgi:hypothetical protein
MHCSAAADGLRQREAARPIVGMDGNRPSAPIWTEVVEVLVAVDVCNAAVDGYGSSSKERWPGPGARRALGQLDQRTKACAGGQSVVPLPRGSSGAHQVAPVFDTAPVVRLTRPPVRVGHLLPTDPDPLPLDRHVVETDPEPVRRQVAPKVRLDPRLLCRTADRRQVATERHRQRLPLGPRRRRVGGAIPPPVRRVLDPVDLLGGAHRGEE